MKENPKHVYAIASLYAAVVAIAVAVANANAPYDPGTPTQLDPAVLAMWGLLYVPTVVLPGVGGWGLRDFGWGLGAIGLASCVLIVGLCGAIRVNAAFEWGDAAIEAFARTGEEVFVRGFVYSLIERSKGVGMGRPGPSLVPLCCLRFCTQRLLAKLLGMATT